MSNFRKNMLLIGIVLVMLLSIASIHAENITDVNSTAPVSSYSNLSTQISEIDDGGILNLTESYKFNNLTDSELIDGVKISKSITVDGRDNYIDGANSARGLLIDSNCNVVLKNLIFKNGYSNSSGGGIYLGDNSNLTIYNCSFINNLVYNSDGGAINAQNGTNVHIHDCLFDNNTAIRESDLEWDEFKAGMGGGICVRINSNLELYSSVFTNNNAHLGMILVISYDDITYMISSLLVKDCLFERNNVKRCGIIYLDELGVGEILDSVFRNNVLSETGTVVDLDACIRATVDNCLFEGNSAMSGGAIRLKVFKSRYVSHVSILNCNFTNNSANNGGAIYSEHGELTVKNCNFNQNTAVKKGGAIYSIYDSISIYDSNFNKNTATNGGGVYLNSENNVIGDCTFSGNSASSKGGAAIVVSGTFMLSNSQFDKNTAANGGAIYLNGESSTVSGCTFSKDTASSRGGAIFGQSGTFKISNNQFNKNSAANGGALYVNGGSATVSGATFFKNSATSKGGAIFGQSGSFKLSNSQFNKNTAANGGAIYLNIEGSTLTGSAFTKNSATSKGGAVYSTVKSVKSSKNTYTSNKAATSKSVYGVFNAKVKQYTHTSNRVKLKVKITSPWQMSASQKIQIILNGPKYYASAWVKTNSKGIATFVIPFNVNINKYTLSVSMSEGFCIVKSWTKVKDKAIIEAPKKVKKPSKIKLTVKNKASKKLIKKTKFTVKVYTGKKYKTYKLKTNAKGILKIKTNNLSKARHKIWIILNNKNYNIKNKVKVKIK